MQEIVMLRKSSLGYKIGVGFILSLFLASLLAIMVSGVLLKQNFDERSAQSSMLVSRFISSSVNQYIGRLTAGLDALNGDADLLRDIFSSLGTPAPRRKNFFKLFTKVEDFARQYELEQVSLYLKPMGRQDYILFSSIVPRENHIFTFSPDQYGADMVEISRDEYGLVSIKDDGLTHYDFRFANDFIGTDQKISLLKVDDKLYLDVNYPLINKMLGADGNEDAFIKKGSLYGVMRLVMPLPKSFIAELEQQTGHKISFFNSRLDSIAGILPTDFTLPDKGSFVAQGTDGIEYLNYRSGVNFNGSELAHIVVSFEKSLLTQKIVSMIFMIFGVNLVSSSLLLGALSFYLRKQVILPVADLTRHVKALSDGDFKSWQRIAAHELTPRSNELQILSQAFRNMGQQLDELVNRLEDKVKERTVQIVQEKQKTQEILNNIGEGILTFDERLIIGDEYSRHVHELFDLKPAQIKGATFQELILNRMDLSTDARDTVYEILRSSLGMSPLSWEANSANLPSTMVAMVQGLPRSMSLDWYPMVNEQGLVERGMLVIKDQTEKLRLQQALEKSTERHECLSEIINVAMKYDMDYIVRFIQRAYQQFATVSITALLDMASTKPDELFVLLHTLKGDARTTGFKRLATRAHDAETILHKYRSRQATDSDRPLLAEALGRLTGELATFSQLLSDLFAKNEVHADGFSCLINLLLPQFREAVAVLKEHGIKVGGFHYDDHIQNWCPENIELIKDMIMHALTNSIDHGYVLPKLEGRLVAEFAKLQVKAAIEQDEVVIEIIDEGHGFNLDKIRQKYQISPHIEDREALSLLLESGITTAVRITNSSGRGVGLNAIKELSTRLGGHTELMRNQPRGARVRITLPLANVVMDLDARRAS